MNAVSYNVYRDGSFLASTDVTEYDDSAVTAGVEYCYTVTAVYDEGESTDSNEACDSAIDPGSIVELSVSNGFTDVGGTDEISINMNNEDPVAGFQFVIDFAPLNNTLLESFLSTHKK